MKSNKQMLATELGDIRLYECPHCSWEWFEFCDADEYPEYCPHCGDHLDLDWKDDDDD